MRLFLSFRQASFLFTRSSLYGALFCLLFQGGCKDDAPLKPKTAETASNHGTNPNPANPTPSPTPSPLEGVYKFQDAWCMKGVTFKTWEVPPAEAEAAVSFKKPEGLGGAGDNGGFLSDYVLLHLGFEQPLYLFTQSRGRLIFEKAQIRLSGLTEGSDTNAASKPDRTNPFDLPSSRGVVRITQWAGNRNGADRRDLVYLATKYGDATSAEYLNASTTKEIPYRKHSVQGAWVLDLDFGVGIDGLCQIPTDATDTGEEAGFHHLVTRWELVPNP